MECSNKQFGCWMAVGDTISNGLVKILEQQLVAFCSSVQREGHANSQLLRIMYSPSPLFSGLIAYSGSFLETGKVGFLCSMSGSRTSTRS